VSQEFPVAAGYNQLPNGFFIPEIFSLKLLARYYEQTLVPSLVNTDYEGEIKNMGDKVHIRRVPEVSVSRYYAGQALVRQVINDEEVTFIIDHGAYFNVPIDDIQRRMADINFQSELEDNAIIQHRRYVDQQVLGAIYADVAAANVLANIVLSANNLPQLMMDFRVALNESYAPDINRFMVVSYAIGGLFLLNPQFVKANEMGDSQSILRHARIGTLANTEIYESPNLAVVGGQLQLLSGTTTGVTFATIFNKTEILRNPDTFGDLVRGLQIFGWKTAQDAHIAKRGATVAS
jgi:hypothetical protein